MKKILYLALGLLAAILSVGVAYSAWQFESTGKKQNGLVDRRDDIFENYDIKKANDTQVNRVKNYEIYLFPSTLYLNDYIDYLDGKSGAVAPEEKYGYIQPSLSGGSVTYETVANGGDTAYLSSLAKNGTYTMSDDSFISGMYSYVYDNYGQWNTTDAGGPAGTVALGKRSVPANTRYLYGDPTLDKSTVTYSDSTTGVSLADTTGERHNWRNLHYYDRFGYWPSLKKDEGRYLPLKITVDENFSNTYYNSVTLTPFADMGDPRDWYVYSFSCWAYVDNTTTPYTAPYYATSAFASANAKSNYVNSDGSANPSLGSFCPTAVSQYFDIIESFEKYTDKDGVIRLFPKFSNGKGYSAGTVKDGGGDAIKTVPELKDENGNKTEITPADQHELYMFYGTEEGSFTSGWRSVSVRVSVLPNVDIDSYYSLSFKVAITNSVAAWPGGWYDIYTLGRDASSGDNKNLPDTLKAYGYGLYNLYLFITQVAESASSTDYTKELETMRQNIVNKSDSKNFPSLYGKNLLPIASAFVGGKSFMLVGEKVREAKFIGDVNFSGSAHITTDEQLTEKYLSADKSFRLINKDLYGYSDDGSGNSQKEENPINSQFPYCYILQNVDFTEATTQYCQIRFQRYYRSDLHFAETNEYAYDRIEFSDVIYEQGFGNYFVLENADVPSSDGTVSSQQVIRLASEEMRGIYDIIMVFRSARSGGSGDIAYNIGFYAYRHTNIFLKIYDGDLTKTLTYYQGADGATSSGSGTAYEFIDHSASPLFFKSYPIGVSVRSDDETDGGSVNPIGTTLAECVNGAVKGHVGYDPTKIKIHDHVTGAVVARYALKADAAGDEGGQYLSFGGSYYELVFEPFKIRKNYIFYITYD